MGQIKLSVRFIIMGILSPGIHVFGFANAIIDCNPNYLEVSALLINNNHQDKDQLSTGLADLMSNPYFNGNTIHVAPPSMYTSLVKVLSEIEKIYQGSGAPLPAMLMAGDEVPHGSWEMSPAVVAS